MPATEQVKESELWTFTLEHYPKPGVQPAVIALQNDQGADVNMLFFCVWCAATGRQALDSAIIALADQTIESWRTEITLTLRRLRDQIKVDQAFCNLTGAMDTRGKILGAEIESERVAQLLLESVAPVPVGTEEFHAPTVAEANLNTYLRNLGSEITAQARSNLNILIDRVFSP